MRRHRIGSAGVVGTAPAMLAVLCLGASAADSPYRPGSGGYPRFGAKKAEPGLRYGRLQDFPLPKTLLYSVSADELLAEGERTCPGGGWSKIGTLELPHRRESRRARPLSFDSVARPGRIAARGVMNGKSPGTDHDPTNDCAALVVRWVGDPYRLGER